MAMTAKEYKAKLGKKVKDMTPEEKKEYGRLRTAESRAKAKTHKMADGKEMTGATHTKSSVPVKPKKKFKIKKSVAVGKGGENKGNIANKKLKCFMRKAKNGATYKTCAVPEKDKQPKKQVRGKPRGEPRKKPVMNAYADASARTLAQKGRAKKARAEKSGNLTATKADGTVKRLKIKKPKKKKVIKIKK